MEGFQVLLICLFIPIAIGNMVQLQKATLDKMLRNYDPSLRPHIIGSADSPTQISVNVFISDIFDVSDSKMEYVIQMYLREIWVDPRLRYPDPEGILQTIPVSTLHKIWTPDLFFNERDGKFHNVQRSNRFARIFADGKVSFNSRLTMKMHCPMNFKYFPFDRQICSFELESCETQEFCKAHLRQIVVHYDVRFLRANAAISVCNYNLTVMDSDEADGYETKDITLRWMDGSPVQVNSKLHISNFILEDFDAGYCDKSSRFGHGCLSVKLQIKRQYGFFLTQIFIPFLILVAVSWLSLWLDARAITLRLSLVVILLCMMMLLTISVEPLLPAASYTKAIDIWIAVCLSLVFGCLLQFILVNQLARRERRVRISENHVTKNGGCHTDIKKISKMKTILEKCSNNHIPLSKKIDFLCRVLFPIAFVIFNCIFWFTYIRGRDSRLILK